jgi:hypothetical protein
MGHEPDGGVTTLMVKEAELPSGKLLVVSVTPLTSLGTRGRPKSVAVSARTACADAAGSV